MSNFNSYKEFGVLGHQRNESYTYFEISSHLVRMGTIKKAKDSGGEDGGKESLFAANGIVN